MRQQPFDGNGHLLCLGCVQPIQHGDFYIEVRQRGEVDGDSLAGRSYRLPAVTAVVALDYRLKGTEMSNDTWEQVGTVEVLRARVYPLDPTSDSVLRTTVYVEPGVYPVYRKCDAYRWMMSGKVNERNEKIGDGLFVMHRR